MEKGTAGVTTLPPHNWTKGRDEDTRGLYTSPENTGEQRETGGGPSRGHPGPPSAPHSRAGPRWSPGCRDAGPQPHPACGGPSSVLLGERGPPHTQHSTLWVKPRHKRQTQQEGPEGTQAWTRAPRPGQGRTHEVTRSAWRGEAAGAVLMERGFRAEGGGPRASQRPPPKARLLPSDVLQGGE